jgi:hypothetical protein
MKECGWRHRFPEILQHAFWELWQSDEYGTPERAALYSPLYPVRIATMGSDFFASFRPKANVTDEPPGSTYLHAMLDEETWALVLISLHEIEAIVESHIACFIDVFPESLVTHPRLLPFGIFLHGHQAAYER